LRRGIVDQYINPAELLNYLIHACRHLGPHAYVLYDAEGITAMFLDGIHRRVDKCRPSRKSPDRHLPELPG
jgi:hypothetical protein